ncbi:hypothetical protein F5Y18DRAFT_396436 [Xylariaceae sp. FL1019]|nr:hypothetical protein F5Y18DRAFT_396436 [Xylariaceae sp. FL1019]
MQLKRKRSDSEMSSSTTSTSNSPPRPALFSPPTPDMRSSTDGFSFGGSSALSPLSRYNDHMSGRTMKRMRDNRPSEHEVHQRTLNKLFAAQRHPTDTCMSNTHQYNEPTQAQPQPRSHAQSTSHQTSLHSFWNIHSQPCAPAVADIATPILDGPRECDDCGQALAADDDAMDIDDVTAETTSCGACGKHVCGHCSISSLGEQRKCLGCADRRPRCVAGGFSWGRGLGAWSR